MSGWWNRKVTVACLAVVLAGCGSSGAGGPGPAASPGTPVSSSPVPSASDPLAAVIEDTGVDVELPAGLYASRVFEPKILLRLGADWGRSDAVGPALRIWHRDPDGVLTVVPIDFAQCDTQLLEHPDAAAIAALVAGAAPLAASQPELISLGDREGMTIRISGTGAGVDEAIDMAKGCVLTVGDRPYPAEAGWVVLMPDADVHVVLVDVGDRTLLIRSQGPAPGGTAAFIDSALAVVGSITFPDTRPAP